MHRIPFAALAALTFQTLAPAAARCTGSALDEALSAFEKGDFPAAIERAQAVPEASEDRARALYLAGEAQLVLDDLPAAERSFGAVLDLRPKAVPALVGLARALTRQGEVDEAETHLSAALELEPKDAGATRALGELYLRADRLEDAERSLRAAYAMDEGDPQSVRALVELLLRMNELDQAGKVVKRFEKAKKKHPLGPFLEGLVHEREHDAAKAIAAYERALELDERFLDAHKNLAILGHTTSDTYRIPERNELAMQHYERYFALGGKDPELQRTYEQLKGFLGQSSKG